MTIIESLILIFMCLFMHTFIIIIMQNSEEKKDRGNQIAIKPFYFQRILMLILCTIQILLFVLFVLKIGHYTVFPIKVLFDSPSLTQSRVKNPHYLYNAALYIFFFATHVIMALFSFKKTVVRIFPHYILYERYIYNIFSAVCYITVLNWAKPLSLSKYVLFTIPIYVSLPLFIIGFLGFNYSLLLMYYEMFFPYEIKAILNDDVLYHEEYNKPTERSVISNGVYSIVRHPMQGSLGTMIIFGGNIYTIDRLIFVVIHISGMAYGVLMQEKRLSIKLRGYQEFKKKVTYRMFPYIF